MSLLSGHPRAVGKRQGLESPKGSAWCRVGGCSINVSSEKGTEPQSCALLPAACGQRDAAVTPGAGAEALWLLPGLLKQWLPLGVEPTFSSPDLSHKSFSKAQ